MILAALLLQLQQTVRVVDPPTHPYVVEATVPVLQDDTLTLQLDDYPTDSRVIARTEGAIGTRWIIYEVCALVDAGDGSLLVHPGLHAPAGALSRVWPASRAPGLVKLELTDDAGALTFSLTGAPIAGMHRRGNVMRTSYHHLNLGRFGWAHLWVTARAATQQLDFVLELHDGIPGPDRRVNSARVITAYPWRSTLPDPVVSPPWLIVPGRYVVPQQFGRPFRFSVGLTQEPEHVGVADWSLGGFLPASLPVPPATYDHAQELIQARQRLSGLLPDPDWGNTPSGPLWPAEGVTQSDEGGGQDRLPLLGARWAATGDPACLELYWIHQLRSQSRARRRYDAGGAPLLVPAVATWSFHDRFLPRFGESGGLADAPWEWDRWPSPWTPPKTFNAHGIASLTRELNDNLALAWLANDPLARLYVLESATRARLTFPYLTLPVLPHVGSTWNSAHAQALLACVAARALGDHQHDQWLADGMAHLRLAQMPSGIFEAHDGDYPSANDPFFGRFLLASGEDQSLFMLAAKSLGESDLVYYGAHGMRVLGTDTDDPGWYYFFPVGPRDGTLTRYSSDADWPPGLHAAMGVVGTSGYYTAWSSGYPTALALLANSPDAPELLRRFTGETNMDRALSVLQSWGMTAPSSHTSAPFEQWYALAGVLSW